MSLRKEDPNTLGSVGNNMGLMMLDKHIALGGTIDITLLLENTDPDSLSNAVTQEEKSDE